ncbi:MAG TPA: hypothetical protein PKL96_10175, partial [Bacteroidales bacterium]|nr:hypothetical protein [Bacteroidales bacterium]
AVAVTAAMDTCNIAAQSTFPEKVGEFMQLRLHIHILAEHIQRHTFSKAGTVIFQVSWVFQFVCKRQAGHHILQRDGCGMMKTQAA